MAASFILYAQHHEAVAHSGEKEHLLGSSSILTSELFGRLTFVPAVVAVVFFLYPLLSLKRK